MLPVCSLLCTAVVFPVSAGAAQAAAGPAQTEEISEAFVREYALNFMQNSRPDADISIDGFVTLYAPDGETVTGYYVTYKNAGVREGRRENDLTAMDSCNSTGAFSRGITTT